MQFGAIWASKKKSCTLIIIAVIKMLSLSWLIFANLKYNHNSLWGEGSYRQWWNVSTSFCRNLRYWWHHANYPFVSFHFHFRKLDDLMTQNELKSQKMAYHSLKTFLHRTETVHSCYSHHKVPWYVHCDISMATQWAWGPVHSKLR